MLTSAKPVVAVCAVRTGSGKSQTTRKVSEILRDKGQRVAVIRHPMPYGDLVKQAVQRFATLEDLDRHECTIEEREEYEHHLVSGNVVFAGVDYGQILKEAEKEADVILWDGGNNDFPFYKPDLWLTVAKLRDYVGPAVARATLELDVGEVSEPIRAGGGYNLVRVVARRPGAERPFEEVREHRLPRAVIRRRRQRIRGLPDTRQPQLVRHQQHGLGEVEGRIRVGGG